MLGKRETSIYGKESLADLENDIVKKNQNENDLTFFQSNHEGEIIDKIHEASKKNIHGIVINAGAYTHTSVAIADALSSVSIPYIEVHISNVFSREKFRQVSFLSANALAVLSGLGFYGYTAGINYLNIFEKTGASNA